MSKHRDLGIPHCRSLHSSELYAGLRMVGDLAGSYVPKAGTALYEKMLQNGELIRRLRPVAEPLANAFAQGARRLTGDALPAEEAANASRFNPRAEALEQAKNAANKEANLAAFFREAAGQLLATFLCLLGVAAALWWLLKERPASIKERKT